MKIDLHCHSKYSHDNYFEPEALIEEAAKKGLDGVCFTEHYSVEASWPVERINVPEDFLVFRGVEISTDRGHLLVYGLKDDSWNIWSGNNLLDCRRVIDRVHAMGAVCVAAHPFRDGESLGAEVERLAGLDALETHNGGCLEKENHRSESAARLKSLPSVGGSDCHWSGQVGRAYTEFKNSVRTLEDLVSRIKAGNCRGVLKA